MIIDLILIGLYAVAVRFTGRALVPAIAFVSTIAFSFIDMSQAAMHVGCAVIYLILIPLSNTKVCMAMLLSAIVNAVSAGYFLSSFYLENFPVYFAVSMIVINLVILLTTFKGLKNGKYTDVDRVVLFRALGLGNLQTHSKTEKRR